LSFGTGRAVLWTVASSIAGSRRKHEDSVFEIS
jgi:hypothetical protein